MFGLIATTIYSAYMFLAAFMNFSSYSYLRSSDDVGLLVLLILMLQVIALLSSGSYLSSLLQLSPYSNAFGSSDLLLTHSLTFSDYNFAILSLFAAYICRSYLSSLTSLRIHSLKYGYDRSLNTILLLLHEKSLLVRSDYIRSLFYMR